MIKYDPNILYIDRYGIKNVKIVFQALYINIKRKNNFIISIYYAKKTYFAFIHYGW